MFKVRIKRIEELEKFDPEFFLADPAEIGLDSAFSGELIARAAKLAEESNGICVAIAESENGDFAIAVPCDGERAYRFVFFNAALCDPLDGEIRIVVHNPQNPDDLLYDEFAQCAPGNYF